MIKEHPNYQAMVDAIRNQYMFDDIIIQDESIPDTSHEKWTHNLWVVIDSEKPILLRKIGVARTNDCEDWCHFLNPGITLEGKYTLRACPKEHKY